VRECQRASAVSLRLRGFSYREIEHRLEVSTSFIAQSQRKFLTQGIQGLKLGYRGSRSYLTPQQKIEI
jgi:transposase